MINRIHILGASGSGTSTLATAMSEKYGYQHFDRDVFIPYFDLVIYLWIPKDIRMRRLEEREADRYGEDIAIGGRRYESYLKFMNWESRYDTTGIEGIR
ncbi:hypothetical protein [Paenibacillus sp. 1001270B_150601_E10]|uniref:hypothetical protein n=1 Tax=Paenibacillus sp. 1001270B_150601_E10 TaxID=2787079 RepID=UPI001E50AF1E|nr:hypothetical protein [Paenibacillus sp. 1001270B_150601_E10]